MRENEKKEYQEKMEKSKTNWDTRMMKNEKMQDLIANLKGEKH